MTSTSYKARQKEILDDLFRGSTSQREAAKQLDELFLEVVGEDEPEQVVRELSDGSRIVQTNPANELCASIRKVISGTEE